MLPCVYDRKRKTNGQFIRNKRKNKCRRISLAEHETKAENIAETSDEQTPVPEHRKYCWRDGRRIMELGYLADQLKPGCSACKNSLNIINTMDETTQGLGSMKDTELDTDGHNPSLFVLVRLGKVQSRETEVFTEDVKCLQSYSIGHGPSFRVFT